MTIRDNVALSGYSTMGLGGLATHLNEVHSVDDVRKALAWAHERDMPVLTVGTGSNIVWQDSGFSGLVIVNRIAGFKIEPQNATVSLVTAGAGELWDSVVARSVAAGLSGIEALSLVPGTAGAVPVQNVGAYGQEIANTLVSIEAIDSTSGEPVHILASECGFGYRTSRFKTTDRGRFIITSITLRLSQGQLQPPFYASLAQYFTDHGITDTTPEATRQAVIAIRSQKLPDPEVVKNCGSFFANPTVSREQFAHMVAPEGREIAHWPTADDRIKLSAAWLIEAVGFKDFHDPETGMATWKSQSLVFVNEHATTTAQLLAFKQKIIDAVQTRFDIRLEQEPELLP